jgi:hypothetical protein
MSPIRPFLAAALLLFCVSGSVSAAPKTVSAEGLSVEGSTLVLKLPDGRVLRGAQLQGAIIHLARGGGRSTAFRLDSITPLPNDPEILRYEYRIQNAAGDWVPACKPNVRGETWGTAMALPEGHPGRLGPITLACASDAVGKCPVFGYKPWAKGPGGEDLLPYHAACVRMVTADYCGDSTPHTRDGTPIDLFDDIGINTDTSAHNPEFALEAGWRPEGAVCVARVRWSEIQTMEQLAQACPRLRAPQACTELSARQAGALLYNRSMLVPRVGD